MTSPRAHPGGQRLAALNVPGVRPRGFAGRTLDIAHSDEETDADRLARRLARWTSAASVEAQPSA